MAKELTDGNFEQEVLESGKLSMIDFWATWCGPCRALAPTIDALSVEYADNVVVGKVDVDANPGVSMKYGVRSLPTILFIKDGEVVDKQVGAVPRPVLEKMLQKHLS